MSRTKIFLLRGARGKLYGLSHWHTDDTISSSDAAAGQFLISLVDTQERCCIVGDDAVCGALGYFCTALFEVSKLCSMW